MRLCTVAVCCAVQAVVSSACVQQVPPATEPSLHVVSPVPQHVPGEAIVQFRTDTSKARIHEIVAAAGAMIVRDLGAPSTYLVRITSERPIDELLARLRGYSEVLHAEPNRVMQIEPPRPIPGAKPVPSGK